MVTTIILARLLAASDFGLVGMATVVTGFVALFNDLGTSSAVIHRKDLAQPLLSSVFWVNIGFGALATATLYFLSSFFAALYHETRVEPLLQTLSASFFISSLGIVHQSLLVRELAFRKLAKLEIASALCGSLVGITGALMGYGVWSLVGQTLANTLCSSILLWLSCKWRPNLAFAPREVLAISGYSLNLTGYNIFNYFVRKADFFLIGRFLGAESLGFYSLAYNIMLYPIQNISSVVGRVLFPLFSHIQEDDSRFRNAYLQVTTAIAMITFPIMFGLWSLARPLVLAVFGPKWEPVALLLMVLAPVGLLHSIATTVGSIYQAKGRTGALFTWGVVSGFLAVTSYIIGLQWGLVGVASSYAVFSFLLIYPCFAIPFKFIELPVSAFVRVIWRPMACSILMLAVVFATVFLVPAGTSDAMLLGIAIPAGMLAYAAATWLLNREKAREVFLALARQG